MDPIGFPQGPMVQPDGTLTHVWQRFFQDLWRKTGAAVGKGKMSVEGTAQNIDGILASLHLNNNGQLNMTNFCTVDAIDNGVDSTIRVYGSGGVGTTWQRQVGGTILSGSYPSFSQSGFARETSYAVYYRPSTATYQVFTSAQFASTLDDELIFCGIIKTPKADNTGGVTGGGGNTGDDGGSKVPISPYMP